MPDTPSNGNGTKLRNLADNTLALLFARYFMPVCLAVIGFLMVRYLDTVEASIKDIKMTMDERARSVWVAASQADNRARDAAAATDRINQMLSDHIQRENEINAALQGIARDHETRLRTLERTR